MEVMTNGDNFNFISKYEIQIERKNITKGRHRERETKTELYTRQYEFINILCMCNYRTKRSGWDALGENIPEHDSRSYYTMVYNTNIKTISDQILHKTNC